MNDGGTQSETLPLLKSQLLARNTAVTHGFTTRDGGLSTGAFASLNLGIRDGDDRAVVETNRRRVLDALGRDDATFVSLKQVHGDDIVEVSHLAGRSIEADGLWTRDKRAVLAVLVADCVPILIGDSRGRAVAAVHAGWRGTRAGIAAKMVARLAAAGIEPADLQVALGPAIGPCCFEIDDDVAAQLREAYPDAGDAVSVGTDGRTNADLWSLNRQSLLTAGVGSTQIDTLRTCTVCTPTFFSHRRDAGETGRQAAIVGFVS